MNFETEIMDLKERVVHLESLLNENKNSEYVPSETAHTLQEVANMTGRNYQNVYLAAKLGTLKAHKAFGTWYVEQSDLDDYKARCALLDKKKRA